jgi:uncharacterized membrane protein
MLNSPGRAALVLVILLGVFFRFGGIDQKLVWHDEVYTRIFAAGHSSSDWGDALYTGRALSTETVLAFQRHNPDRSVADTVRGLAQDEPQHPPLYYILARGWVSLFGDGIGTLRSLSALLSLLGFPAIYWLCRELFASTRVAWIGVGLLACSPFFVLYAQEAREYALWSTLLLFSTAALLRAVRLTEASDSGQRWAWLSYCLVTAGALYTSFSSAPVIAVHILWICWRERLRPNRVSLQAAAALGLSALIFVPWARMLYAHYDAFQASMAWIYTIVIPQSELLRILALNLSRPLIDLWPDLQDWPSAIGVTVALVLAVASWVRLRRCSSPASAALVWLLIWVPTSLLIVPDLLFGGIRSLSARYLTASLLGILLAMAHLLGSGRTRRHELGTALVLAAGVLSCGWNLAQQAPWTKGISRALPQAAAVINQEVAPWVVGNREQHHPGNLLSLSNLLRPDARMVLLPIGQENDFVLPQDGAAVFLYSPTPPFRDDLVDRYPIRITPVIEGLHLQLWQVEELPR